MTDRGPREMSTAVLLDRLRRAQAVARVGSWELDLATGKMWGSEEAFRIYGLEMPPDQVLPLNLIKEIPQPEYRPLLDRALHDLIAGRGKYDVEFEILRPADEQIRVVHSLAEIARAPDGAASAVIGTMQDVTERRAISDALRESEERVRMILEHSADAIVLGSSDGAIVELNEQACHLTGYSRDELLGSHVSRLFAAAELERAPLRFDLIDRGEAVILERDLRRKDGATVPVEMHSKLMPNGMYQTIYRDIRERRRLEEQLRLRQRMDSIGELASGIAHDFNNILVAIVGYTELLNLDRENLSEPNREKVSRLLIASRRASDLVGRLQGLSHPESTATGAFDLHTVATDAVQVLAETTDRCIRVDLDLEPGLCLVNGSESDIYHALVNLGLNGVQAIEERGPVDGDAIRIGARPCSVEAENLHGLEPGEYVEVLVSDTGPGMSPEVKARAFDPLFTTKQRGEQKGQGLGLTMVYNTIVTAHGGAIDVETSEGHGTVFHLFLPSAIERADEVREESVLAETGSPSGTILVIDDEAQIIDIAREVLERAGHYVIAAEDGVKGLEEWSRHASEIDLLIIDVSLPRLSGTEVMKAIRQERPGTEIILSSGNRVKLDIDEGKGVRLLPKPYEPGELLAMVAEVLRGKKATS